MIKTWQQRCEEHPDHQQGMVTEQMIQDRMQEEIDELRKAAEMALKFMDWFASDDHSLRTGLKAPEIAEALRQALAQPEQEPVNNEICFCRLRLSTLEKVYNLTDEQMSEWIKKCKEHKLKEKNT